MGEQDIFGVFSRNWIEEGEEDNYLHHRITDIKYGLNTLLAGEREGQPVVLYVQSFIQGCDNQVKKTPYSNFCKALLSELQPTEWLVKEPESPQEQIQERIVVFKTVIGGIVVTEETRWNRDYPDHTNKEVKLEREEWFESGVRFSPGYEEIKK